MDYASWAAFFFVIAFEFLLIDEEHCNLPSFALTVSSLTLPSPSHLLPHGAASAGLLDLVLLSLLTYFVWKARPQYHQTTTTV